MAGSNVADGLKEFADGRNQEGRERGRERALLGGVGGAGVR